jgi:AcrR family transcriptional regulator
MAHTRKRTPAAVTREHVLDVAHDLFYWCGIHSVGVDRVADKAGVAPPTLYRLFESKDEIVEAYLDRAGVAYQAWFEDATRADGRSARARILALFDALEQQIRPDRCRGCPFLMALSEYPDARTAVHRRAAETKAWVRARIRELVEDLPSTCDSDALADHLMLLFEGVYATVAALGNDGPAARARSLVNELLPREDRRRG